MLWLLVWSVYKVATGGISDMLLRGGRVVQLTDALDDNEGAVNNIPYLAASCA